MLASRGRLERPLEVHVIGQRDVHRVDLWVGEQLLVRCQRPTDPQRGGVFRRIACFA